MDMYQKRKIRKENKENDREKSFTNVSINWYPGHMAKTKRQIKEIMPIIDIVFELIDARIPFSSKIHDIDDIIKNKKRILVMTKKDLCDLNETSKWASYYEKMGYKVVITDLSDNLDYQKILDISAESINEINEIRKNKGLMAKEIKALVIGVPNVGKSTFINKLAGKKVAQTGNKPGVTKNNVWLKTKYKMAILDTPGILWPKIEDNIVGLNLAAMSAIKDEILPINDVGYYILKTLNDYYPSILKSRYGLEKISDDVEKDYQIISEKLNIKSSSDIDYRRINIFILNDIKNENIKGLTFDRR